MTCSDFIAWEIYFIFGTKFSRNEGIDTCFNVECVLLGRNFNFLGGYCSLPRGYCSLLFVTWWLLTARYWWLLLVTTRYCSLPFLVWTNYFRNISFSSSLLYEINIKFFWYCSNFYFIFILCKKVWGLKGAEVREFWYTRGKSLGYFIGKI